MPTYVFPKAVQPGHAVSTKPEGPFREVAELTRGKTVEVTYTDGTTARWSNAQRLYVAPASEATKAVQAVHVLTGMVVAFTAGGPAARVLRRDEDQQRTVRLTLDGPLPLVVLDQRHEVTAGGQPRAGYLVVPYGGKMVATLAEAIFASSLSEILTPDGLDLKSSATAAEAARVLTAAIPTLNAYRQIRARLLRSMILAAFPDVAPPARERTTRTATPDPAPRAGCRHSDLPNASCLTCEAERAEEVAAAKAKAKAEKAAEARKPLAKAGAGERTPGPLTVFDGLIRDTFGH